MDVIQRLSPYDRSIFKSLPGPKSIGHIANSTQALRACKRLVGKGLAAEVRPGCFRLTAEGEELGGTK